MRPTKPGRRRQPATTLAALAAIWLVATVATGPAAADQITNSVAVFAALDKVTARISKLEVPIDTTVEFGALRITPKVCYTRPPTETPKTTAFVEVDEEKLDGTSARIFGGWMFAQSPGLHAVEHPVFDVWLTDCAGESSEAASAAVTGDETGEADAQQGGEQTGKKRRAKRR